MNNLNNHRTNFDVNTDLEVLNTRDNIFTLIQI